MKLAPPAGAEPCKGRMCPRVPFKSLFAGKKRLLLKKQCGGGLRPPHAVLFSPKAAAQSLRGGFSPAPAKFAGGRAAASFTGGKTRGRYKISGGRTERRAQADMGRRGAFFFTNMPYPLAFSANLW